MNTRTAFKSALLARSALLAMSALGALAVPSIAHAQSSTAAAEQAHDFNVPAQPLARALSAIAEQGDIQIVYPDREPNDLNAPAVKGRMSVTQALSTALAGSGYSYRWLRDGVVTLTSAEGNVDGERVTGAVRVEGTQGSPYFGGAGVVAGVNGINGSRDITATEGTGSFTSGALTIGSKVPQAMKDVPQSISVLTTERLEQQNVTDFTTAMKQLPGVSLVQGGSSLENTFYSRGFAVTSIQVDGGAPLSTRFGTVQGFFPQIDMSIYDHVELLRGAAGQFNGFGEPGGTVNLVRKKPLDHAQFSVEAQAGSWSNYRVVADATSPLALDGKLRGRLVMTYQDNHYFYDTAKDNKTLIYGIAELDATPTTLLTAGMSYTRQDSVPWVAGLPRYRDGADLGLPRSTCLCFEWNRWDFDTTEIFGGVEQKLGGEWTAKLNLTYNRQRSTQKVGFSAGAIDTDMQPGDPITDPNGGALLNGSYDDFVSKQFSAEASLSGAFEIFGQRQEITVGINRVNSDASGRLLYNGIVGGNAYQPYTDGPIFGPGSPNGVRPPINVFDFDPRDPIYTEPRNPLVATRYLENGQTQTVAYANFRLTAFDRLHLITGLRWSRFDYKNTFEYLCVRTQYDCANLQIGDRYDFRSSNSQDTEISWPPAVTLTFDVTSNLNAYFGYTDIYQSQSNYLDGDLKPIQPITGSNLEGGLKWQAHGGRLNFSLAAFRIKTTGFPTQDGTWDYDVTQEDIDNGIYGYFVASNGTRVPNGQVGGEDVTCCWKSDPTRSYKSEGLDFEVGGEVLPGWQIAANYTFNRTRQEGTFFGGANGKVFVSIQPEHLFKLWTSFDFGASGRRGWLGGLTVSAGVNGQSSAYYSGSVCLSGVYVPYPSAPTYRPCIDPEVPFEFTVPSYAVVSSRIDYRFSDTWSLSVNLDNIFDKTYYQSVGSSPISGNWYGAPRSVTAALRAKW